jgi:hypothetical protein
MDNRILIKIIILGVIIPIIAAIIKSYKQKSINDELQEIKKENNETHSEHPSKNTSHHFVNKGVSEYIDSYNHPNYFVPWTGYFALIVYWILIGIFIPYAILFILFELLVVSIIAGVLINIIFIVALRNSINTNSNRVVIELFTDKITFVKVGYFKFEIPFEKITDLNVVTEKGVSVWPDEFVNLEIDSNYKKSVIDHIVLSDESDEFSQLMKIRYSNETKKLKGANGTIFKQQLFKWKFGKEIEQN